MPLRKLLYVSLAGILLFSCDKEDDSLSPANSNLKQGLLLYLPFDGNLADSSGNSNNGTAFGTISYGNNRYFENGQALVLNGTDNRIEISGSNFDTLSKFTMYIEFMPYNTNSMALFSRAQFVPTLNPKQAFNALINYQGAGTRFQIKQAGNCDNTNTQTAFGAPVIGQALASINGWNYLAITYDGNTILSYLNGNLVASDSQPGATLCSGAPLIVGSWWQGDANYFNGRVDELRLYNRVLSTDEISQIYQLHK